MKGKIIKTDRGWEVEYEEKVPELHFLAKQTVAIPLHPDDVKQINADGQVFDNIKARIAAYPDVEFELIDKIIDLGRHGSTIIRYAKITKTGAFDKEGNAITRGYVAPTESWSNVEKEYHNYSWEEGENKKFPMEYSDWLKEFYLAPIKK